MNEVRNPAKMNADELLPVEFDQLCPNVYRIYLKFYLEYN